MRGEATHGDRQGLPQSAASEVAGNGAAEEWRFEFEGVPCDICYGCMGEERFYLKLPCGEKKKLETSKKQKRPTPSSVKRSIEKHASKDKRACKRAECHTLVKGVAKKPDEFEAVIKPRIAQIDVHHRDVEEHKPATSISGGAAQHEPHVDEIQGAYWNGKHFPYTPPPPPEAEVEGAAAGPARGRDSEGQRKRKLGADRESSRERIERERETLVQDFMRHDNSAKYHVMKREGVRQKLSELEEEENMMKARDGQQNAPGMAEGRGYQVTSEGGTSLEPCERKGGGGLGCEGYGDKTQTRGSSTPSRGSAVSPIYTTPQRTTAFASFSTPPTKPMPRRGAAFATAGRPLDLSKTVEKDRECRQLIMASTVDGILGAEEGRPEFAGFAGMRRRQHDNMREWFDSFADGSSGWPEDGDAERWARGADDALPAAGAREHDR